MIGSACRPASLGRAVLGWMLLVAMAGCGETPTGVRVTADDLRGSWVLSFEEAQGSCLSGPAAPFAIHLEVTDAITDILSGDVWVVAEWRDSPGAEAWAIGQGRFRPREARFELVLWGATVQDGAPHIALVGTLDARPGITGTWQEMDGGVLHDGDCAGTVRGERQAS